MSPKCLKEPLIKSNEQINFSQKSEMEDPLRTISHQEKWLEKFIDGKGFSAPQKLSDLFFQCNQNTMIHLGKQEKCLKSKNDPKRTVGAFNRKLSVN